MIALYTFLFAFFGYWMGRDANKRPYQKGDYLAPVVLIWALVGCFMFIIGVNTEGY